MKIKKSIKFLKTGVTNATYRLDILLTTIFQE